MFLKKLFNLCKKSHKDDHSKLTEVLLHTGELQAYNLVKLEMEKLYGLPADEWCRQMYEFIKKKLKSSNYDTDITDNCRTSAQTYF